MRQESNYADEFQNILGNKILKLLDLADQAVIKSASYLNKCFKKC